MKETRIMDSKDRWIPKHAFSPMLGCWEWETPDGICCITFNHEVIQEGLERGLLDINAENKILKEQNKKDSEGNLLVLQSARDYFLKVKAPELGGIDSPLFQQEYCNAWDADTKKLAAFYNFDFVTHTKHYKPILAGAPVNVFIDFGLHHPCAGILQVERYAENQEQCVYHFHDVIRGQQVDLETFIDGLLVYLNRRYSDCPQYWYPVQEAKIQNAAGIQTKDGARSPLQVLQTKGIYPQPQIYSKIEPRVRQANILLNTYDKGKPTFNFNPSSRYIRDMDSRWKYSK